MGKAHRFQRPLIDKALTGVESVLAEYDVLPDAEVAHPGWQKILGGDQEKRWLRANTGGLVDMQWGPTPLVHHERRFVLSATTSEPKSMSSKPRLPGSSSVS